MSTEILGVPGEWQVEVASKLLEKTAMQVLALAKHGISPTIIELHGKDHALIDEARHVKDMMEHETRTWTAATEEERELAIHEAAGLVLAILMAAKRGAARFIPPPKLEKQ